MFKRVSAFALSAVLAVSLCPAAAFAAPVQAGGSEAFQTQAGKSAAYVITKVTKTGVDARGKKTPLDETRYSYQGNGLLRQSKTFNLEYPDEKPLVSKYLYKGAILKGVSYGGPASKVAFNEDGLPVRVVSASSDQKIVYDISYKSGYVVKVKETNKFKSGKKWTKSVIKSRYKYRKGRVVKRVDGFGWGGSRTFAYSYDKYGNTKKFVGAYGTQESVRYKNTYNAKKLVTRKVAKGLVDDLGQYKSYIYTYEYKRVKVNSSLKSQVAEQRWALVNDNRNFALGTFF